MVFIDMTDWRAKLTDSEQPVEKSARVKNEFLVILFVLLFNSLGNKTEKSLVSSIYRTAFGQLPV